MVKAELFIWGKEIARFNGVTRKFLKRLPALAYPQRSAKE
jgi:hypothetical protein